MTIGVLVVDDQALLRTAFSSLIEAEADMHVVGDAADGQRAVELARRLTPDVVLMDVRMPVMDGIEATRRITAGSGGSASGGSASGGSASGGSASGGSASAGSGGAGRVPRVLILTTFDLDDYVFEALKAGASGFLLKSRPLEELLSAIRVVAEGEALLAPSVTRRLISHFVELTPAPDRPPPGFDELTDREREVLTLVAQGLTNAELASSLHLSMPTVKTHVSRILTKLGARDRTQLVVIAYESGMMAPR